MSTSNERPERLDAQKRLLRHALGLDEQTGAGESKRNWFCAARDHEVCVELEAKGWLKWTDDTWTIYRGMWRVTPAGRAEAQSNTEDRQ